MYRKKLVAAVLVALMATSAACQRETKKDKKDKDEEETTVEVTETEETTEETTEATTEETTEETTEATTTEPTEPEKSQEELLTEELMKICKEEGVATIGHFDSSVFEKQDNQVGGTKYYQKCKYSEKGVLFARIDEFFGEGEFGMLVVVNQDEGIVARLYGFTDDAKEVTELGREPLNIKLDDITIGMQEDPWYSCNRNTYAFAVEEEEDGFVLIVNEKVIGYDTDDQKVLIYAIDDQGITSLGGAKAAAHIFVGGEIPGEDSGISFVEFDEKGERAGDWQNLTWDDGVKTFNESLESNGVKKYGLDAGFHTAHNETRGENYYLIPLEEADFVIQAQSECENVEAMLEVDAPTLDIKDQSKDMKLYDSLRTGPVADAGDTDKTEPTEPAPTETTAVATNSNFAENEALYAPVLGVLSNLVTSGERYLEDDKIPAEFTFGKQCPNGIFFEESGYSYWFDDIDADGTAELFVGSFLFDMDMNPAGNSVNYLVTKTDSGFKFVAQGWVRSFLGYVGNGYFAHEGSGGAAQHYNAIYHYDGESKELITDVELITDYISENEKVLSAYVEGVEHPSAGGYKDDPNALHGDDAQAKWDEEESHIKGLPMPWAGIEKKSLAEFQAPIA